MVFTKCVLCVRLLVDLRRTGVSTSSFISALVDTFGL